MCRGERGFRSTIFRGTYHLCLWSSFHHDILGHIPCNYSFLLLLVTPMSIQVFFQEGWPFTSWDAHLELGMSTLLQQANHLLEKKLE